MSAGKVKRKLTARNYEEALGALEKAIVGNPVFFPARAFRAVTYAELGRDEEARAETALILKKSSATTITVWKHQNI